MGMRGAEGNIGPGKVYWKTTNSKSHVLSK